MLDLKLPDVYLKPHLVRRNYGEYYATKGRGPNPPAGLAMPNLSLLYFTPSFPYLLVRRRFFEVSIPLDVGIGRSHYTVTDAQNQLVTDTRDTFVPAEARVAHAVAHAHPARVRERRRGLPGESHLRIV